MIRPYRTYYRPRPALRAATAAAGLLVLAAGWRLTAGEPAAARPSDLDAPADYVPDTPDFPEARVIDPLPALAPALQSAFGAPLDFLRVTSGFGMRRHPILGFTRMHQGVDFAAPEGAPVLAPADGVVAEAGPSGGYGNLLRVRHMGGWETGYAHLSAFAPGVAPGVVVQKGEVIAFVGHTGLATGPHLHYEVSHYGVKLDPLATPFGEAPTGAQPPPAANPDLTQASGLRLRPAETADGASPRA